LRFQGRIGRRMEAEEWFHRIISVTSRRRTPSSASIFISDSTAGVGKKMGGKKWIILLPMIPALRSANS